MIFSLFRNMLLIVTLILEVTVYICLMARESGDKYSTYIKTSNSYLLLPPSPNWGHVDSHLLYDTPTVNKYLIQLHFKK